MKQSFGVFVLFASTVLVGCNQERRDADSHAPELGDANLFSSSWPSSAASDDKLKQLGLTKPEWHDLEFDGMKIAVAVETMPSWGESYIDVYGYVFNRSFKEWRRFLAANTRHAGHIEISLDSDNGQIVVLGAANNDLNGKRLVTFDLGAVSDGRAYDGSGE